MATKVKRRVVSVPHNKYCQCVPGVTDYINLREHEIIVGGVVYVVTVHPCALCSTHPQSLNEAMEYLEATLGVHFRDSHYRNRYYETVRDCSDSFKQLLRPEQWALPACRNRCAPYRDYFCIEDEIAFYSELVLHCGECGRPATKSQHEGFYRVQWYGDEVIPNKGELFCSRKCQRRTHEYKEFMKWERAKEWAALDQRGRERMDAMLCKEQIKAVKSYLSTGNREALQSRLEELSLLTTSPAS